MGIIFLGTSAAVAIVFSVGLTAWAEEPAGPVLAPGGQPAGAPQDVRATVVSPAGRHQQSATVEQQQVPVGDGETVTVLRPVTARGDKASGPEDEKAPGEEENVERDWTVGWQVAAGRRLWLIDPATGDLRTCAVRNTSTVGVEEIRCLSVSGARF